MLFPHHYYYKIIPEEGEIFFARTKDPLRNITQATFRTGRKVKEFYPSSLILYFYECIKRGVIPKYTQRGY